MSLSTPVQAELIQRIHWLVKLRWIAASFVLYGTIIATVVLGVPVDPWPLYAIAATIMIYNSWFLVAIKWTQAVSDTHRPARARLIAIAQIVMDLLLLTLLIHFTGGAENPFAFYYVFHIVIASILLPRRDTFLVATVGNLFFAALVVGEASGFAPHDPLVVFAWVDPSRSGVLTAAALLVFSSTLYLVAYMATSIVGRLRERDRAIMILNDELSAKTAELELAFTRLSELEAAKSQYMRKMAHELRAPMTAIQSLLRVVLDGLVGALPDKQREMIARAERRVQGLLGLVADLLTLSRATDLSTRGRIEPVDLTQMVEKVASLQSPRAAEKRITLSTLYYDRGLIIQADSEGLEQVVTNLVSNAINYTPSSGRVEVALRQRDGFVEITVADTGIGIPTADQPKIFTEFFRARNAREYQEQGTGLGLSIVRSIVDSLGGRIAVESTVGVGTAFTVILPREGISGAGGAGLPAREEAAGAEREPVLSRVGVIEGDESRQQPPRPHQSEGGGHMMVNEVATQRTRATATVRGRDWLPDLLKTLQTRGPVYGPTRKSGAYVFAPVSSHEELALDYTMTVLPPKKLLLAPMETLFSVRVQKGFEARLAASVSGQVLFGVHSCDLSALGLLDKVYRQSYVDPVYAARRDTMLVVGLACTAPAHGNCFCASMGTGPVATSGFDLMVTRLDDEVLLEAGSANGEAVLRELRWDRATDAALARKEALEEKCAADMPKSISTAGLRNILDESWDHVYWSRLEQKCLACANCSMSCPSCYCYNVLDKVGLDTSSVQRNRTWDACLLLEFAEVHGGNFRSERSARIKQYVYHKLNYWVDQYGAFGCVGCGRCIGACPAGIDITETVAEIRGESQ